jgi:hypothetical protein
MESVEADGGLQVTGDESATTEHAVVAPLEQLFTGLRVGLPTLTARCCACGTELGEGDTVSVYAYRTVTLASRSVSLPGLRTGRHRNANARRDRSPCYCAVGCRLGYGNATAPVMSRRANGRGSLSATGRHTTVRKLL